jgi:hypothetical protein
MCWNAPVSYASFIFGLWISWILWTRPSSNAINKKYDYWNVLFILAFVSMQVGEGFIHQGKQWGRWIIWISVILQPIAQTLGSAYFGGNTIWYFWTALCILVAPFLHIDDVVKPGTHGHLEWSVQTKIFQPLYVMIYMIGAIVPLLWMSPLSRFGILPFYMILTMLYSLYYFYNKHQWSSMWCFFACVYSVIAYIVNTK